jgi:membrane-associated protease RseP (regulator of RpoE activity)
MAQLSSWITGVVAIGFLIGVHEAGHYLAAKMIGLKVNKFSVGFGRPLLRRKVWGTEFQLSSFPIGGFVSVPSGDEKGAVDAMPRWKQAVFYGGGIVLNLAFCFVLLFFVYLHFGRMIPTSSSVKVYSVESGGAGDRAGVRIGDVWNAVGNKNLDGTPGGTARAVMSTPGGVIIVSGARGGKPENWQIGRAGTYIGVGVEPAAPMIKRPLKLLDLGEGVAVAFGGMRNITKQVGVIFGKMIRERSVKGLSGPIGMVRVTSKLIVGERWGQWVVLLAAVSLQLGLFNLLPIPVLDGGYLVFIAIEALIGKTLDKALKDKLVTMGAVALIGFTAFMFIVDLARI